MFRMMFLGARGSGEVHIVNQPNPRLKLKVEPRSRIKLKVKTRNRIKLRIERNAN